MSLNDARLDTLGDKIDTQALKVEKEVKKPKEKKEEKKK